MPACLAVSRGWTLHRSVPRELQDRPRARAIAWASKGVPGGPPEPQDTRAFKPGGPRPQDSVQHLPRSVATELADRRLRESCLLGGDGGSTPQVYVLSSHGLATPQTTLGTNTRAHAPL